MFVNYGLNHNYSNSIPNFIKNAVNFPMKKTQYSRQDFDFWSKARTRWNDMDGLRHINHAAYLAYMETARLDLYYSLGQDLARWDADISTILASANIDYLAQITHPTELEIGQRVSRVGHKSFDLFTGIFAKDSDTPIVIATFTLVAYNYKIAQTIPVPEMIQKHHRPFT